MSAAAVIANKSVPKGAESVRASFLRVSVGLAIYSASQWAIVAVLAKLGTPELVGQYALGVALTTPVLMLAQMNLRVVLATDVYEVHSFRQYRNLRFGLLALAMVVILGLAFQQAQGRDRILVIVLVGLIQAGEWISDIFLGRMQQQGRIGRTAPALMARGILGVIALAAGLRFSGSLVIALVWSLVCRNLVFFAYESTFALRGFPPDGPPAPASREWAAQWEILKKALPLGIVLMLNALVLNAPRYFVAASLGERALGIFSAIFSLATAGNLIMNSLGQSATTRLARLHMASDASGFLRLALKMAALGVAIALAGLVCAATIGPWALRLVYRQEYADHASLLVVAMAAAGIGFVATLLGYTITAARRFTQQMPLQLACLAATALASFVLVPRIGLTGAALSVGIGSLVQMLGEAWILRQVLAEMRSVSSRSSQAVMA